MRLEDATADEFERHIGSVFTVDMPPISVALVLEAVIRHPAQPGAPRPEPFSLEFTGPPESPLDQAIHLMNHDALGPMEVFLVPIGPGRYEAVFN